MTFDPPPEPCPCGSPNCPCGKCHGVGWAWVTASYPLAQVPEPPVDLLEALDPAALELLHTQLAAARAAAAASVYPCRACNASLFFDARDACGFCAGRPADWAQREGKPCPGCKGSGLSWRNTYAHALRRHGGDLVDGSAAALQWGPAYRQLHRRILAECIRVVVEDGMLAVNMSNHVREGVEQLVTEWWLNEIIVAGCRIREVRRVESRRQRHGANGGVRVDGECLIVAHTPTQRRLV